MATKQRMVKLTLYARRKSHLSEDEFQKYWTETHRGLAVDWLAKYGIVKYTQYHTPSELVSTAIAGFPALQGVKKLTFDGIGEFLMPEVSCFHKAREDPYYAEVIAPDEDKLFDWNTAEWTIGWEEVYIKDGKVVDMPFGDAGEVSKS
ncbi:hypothetical protein Z517_11244 [Fonsecaea pedrosoi CBS 271.37]|uniref:EthD domain-containing protein n=1 Tax=Fonsecaea pedrosoi CBS 271.37 TaxID=1442368 RepID=A0A0D2G7A9_9EURO|nr:uncharacterized protein Z517_11244 [Fonsecaea pedrosoi CBS 271.37]KIW76498.1 hypothetical protein Z517_11244 [Fonsecaea pedrosoi CBS 271.37]